MRLVFPCQSVVILRFNPVSAKRVVPPAGKHGWFYLKVLEIARNSASASAIK